MKKIRKLLAAILMGTILMAMTPIQTGAHTSMADTAVIFDAVNQARIANGIPALTWELQLVDEADIRAMELATKYSHTRPDGTAWYTVNETMVWGECVSKGEARHSAENVVTAWMLRPCHKAVILEPRLHSVAVSCYQANGYYYVAAEFGL